MMHGLLGWILRHPVSVLLAMVVMILIGGLSLVRLPVEIRPEQQTQQIRITAHYPGQTPETVQRLLTMPLEDIAAQIRDVRSVRSTSGVGYADVTLEFPPKTELKYAYIEIQERVALLRESLPREVSLDIEPYFGGDEAEQFQRSAFFSLELSGPMTLNRVWQLADEQIVPAVKGLEGVGNVRVYGGSPLYIRLDLREDRITQLGIRPADIGRALRTHLTRAGSGVVEYQGSRFLLLFSNLPAEVRDIANIPLSTGGGWRIGDFSTVSLDFEQPTSLSRHNYNPLVSIEIYKAAGTNALRFSENMYALLDELQGKLPADITLRVTRDSADDLRFELHSLLVRSGVIFLVVFLVLLVLFRRLFLSAIILSVILLSLLCAAILLYFSGYTMNVVTLAGIALVFGMLVDNAVVVMENIHRCETGGLSTKESGLQGTVQMVQPMLAATATTLLVFFSLLLLQDRLGAYYRPMAFALGFTLLASLGLALTLIPAMYVRFRSWIGSGGQRQKSSRIFNRIRDGYERVLRWNLRHRMVAYLVIIILLGSSTYLFLNQVPRGGFFSWGTGNELRISVRAPRGVPLQVLDDIARGFEDRIRASHVPCDVQTMVNARSASARIVMTFPDTTARSLDPYRLKEQLAVHAVNYAGVGIYVSGFGDPFSNGGYRLTPFYNTRLHVTGPQYDQLWTICESILDLARESPRVSEGAVVPSSRSLYNVDLKQVTLSTSMEDVWSRGWTYQSFLEQVRLWFQRRIRQNDIPIGDQRFPVAITLGEEVPDLADIQDAVMTTPAGARYRAGELLHTAQSPLALWIDKEDQQYRFTIAWEYKGPPQMRQDHEQRIVENIQLPPGYQLQQQDWSFLTTEEQANLLKVLLVVLVGTYMILAALYESFSRPLVIFLSVPFALTGIFFGYYLFGRSFDVNGYIGVILLTGIVVNNAIILVDRIAQLSIEGMSLVESIVQGTLQRVRPILITTITTIGGLIPLLFLETEESFLSGILEELSFVTITGLLGSTLLTVTVIPLVYYSIEKFRYRFSTLKQSAMPSYGKE